MKRLFQVLALLMALLLLLTGCQTSSGTAEEKQPEETTQETQTTESVTLEDPGDLYWNVKEGSSLLQNQKPASGSEIAIMKTSLGDITIMFFPSIAPKAVENFITHAKDGYYNGLTFHRVMNDFMIQGGDPTGTGRGGESIWGEEFEDEFSFDLWNFRGALSMANAGSNTNGSQFFIVQAPSVDPSLILQMRDAGWFPADVIEYYKEVGGTPWLDQRHTVFGQVIAGMDVVDKIAAVETDEDDKPLEDVIIAEIQIKTVA